VKALKLATNHSDIISPNQGERYPSGSDGKDIVALAACYAGSLDEGERVLRPLREFGSPVADLVGPLAYRDLQRTWDADFTPTNFQNYWKSDYLRGLSDDAIDTIVTYAAGKMSPLSEVDIIYLGGAFSRVKEDETAFSHRNAAYFFTIESRWSDPTENEKHIRWNRRFWEAMRPFTTGGVYVNFLMEEGDERVKAAYGPGKYERLVALKNKYDPTNFFRQNQNIKPTV
jgi:FAD/FMN-containing dehydrogenase